MWLQDHICFGKRCSQVRVTRGAHITPFRLAAFGTFPILRPIFHKMKNAGRVILEECKGQARRTAERSHEQLIYRNTTLSHRLRRCQLPFREHIKFEGALFPLPPHCVRHLPYTKTHFHKMKNAGRVILEECKGQARRIAEHKQVSSKP